MTLALTDSDAPALCNLTGQIVRDNDYCSAHGGFSDIWMGTWLKGIERCKVAIKVLRVSNENEDTQEKMNKVRESI
ncbi:hypothetical protein PILCRDRAFT_17433 [Piloderma croceum F 1598]|uniref:Protein kinase domain-containing protein n=1 Tax=Piloderma croceum (strain F 1598) TaxID=765440 RepID=A0A0C3EEF4_PILCF|nr:hypothetical protein PILCRDRAFT_17433 [Piloderma croceum F 1598]